MQQNDIFDLERGFKQYEACIKNLKGIFDKVGSIIDISSYKEEVDNICDEVLRDKSIDSTMPSDEMQLEYEGMVLAPYIKRLNEITDKLNREVLPFYEVYLLSNKINMLIDRIGEDTITEIINNSILLINSINKLNTHNSSDKNEIISFAYKVIYRVILNEEIFDRSDVLDFINKLNISTNRENLGRLLVDDIDMLDREDIIDDDLSRDRDHILGNDYLSSTVIKKISFKTVGHDNSEYKARKRKIIESVKSDVDSLIERKNKLNSDLDSNKRSIRNLKLYRSLLGAKIFAFAMVPVISFYAGNGIGKKVSSNIIEYNTVTRTVDYDTGKIIGDVESRFLEEKSSYSATVLSCSPWKKNPAGVGYIRNVTTYEYIQPEDSDDAHRITREDLEKNVVEKYSYVETKDELDDGDSMVDSSILITESYFDGTTRKSTKFVLPFSIGGGVLGLIITLILALTRVYDFEEISRKLNLLALEIKEKNMSNEEIKNMLKDMLDEALKVREAYNDAVIKYGSFGDELIIDEIDTSWIMGNDVKKHMKEKL